MLKVYTDNKGFQPLEDNFIKYYILNIRVIPIR